MAQSPASSACIMIVDDVDVRRDHLEFLLTEAGYTSVLIANNGYEALHILRGTTPDLVLFNLTLPQMSGAEFCKTVRSLPEHTSTPLIAMQARPYDSKPRVETFEAGVSDIINHPAEPLELLPRIKLQLERAAVFKKLEEYRSLTESEVERARQMQMMLLPTQSKLAEIEFHYQVSLRSFFQPSTTISGDSWGIIPLDDHRLAFHISDFTCHGIGSAIDSFRMHMLLSQFEDTLHAPDVLLSKLNQQLKKILSTEIFVTFFYGVLDLQAGQLSYATAGAPMPYIHRDAGNYCEGIDSSGVPLGISNNCRYPLQQIAFNPGDTLVLYSDALFTQDMDEALLKELLMKHMASSSKSLGQKHVTHQILNNLGILDGRQYEDDITLFLLTRHSD